MEVFYFLFYMALGYSAINAVAKLISIWNHRNDKDITTDYDYEMYLQELEDADKRRDEAKKTTNEERAEGWK